MRNLLLIDAITRTKDSEDPVYLDKEKTEEYNSLYFSLGENKSKLSNRNAKRILSICYWKLLEGLYFLKPWEKFLERPISPDGRVWVEEQCPDVFCGHNLFRDPKSSSIYCPHCKRNHLKAGHVPVNIGYSFVRRLKPPFCHSCGSQDPMWVNSEKIQLCSICFYKHGDISFESSKPPDGTKIQLSAQIILAGRNQS